MKYQTRQRDVNVYAYSVAIRVSCPGMWDARAAALAAAVLAGAQIAFALWTVTGSWLSGFAAEIRKRS